jgi:hypothetical protein
LNPPWRSKARTLQHALNTSTLNTGLDKPLTNAKTSCLAAYAGHDRGHTALVQRFASNGPAATCSLQHSAATFCCTEMLHCSVASAARCHKLPTNQRPLRAVSSSQCSLQRGASLACIRHTCTQQRQLQASSQQAHRQQLTAAQMCQPKHPTATRCRKDLDHRLLYLQGLGWPAAAVVFCHKQ